jgi:Putative peptidoglycan binding domain
MIKFITLLIGCSLTLAVSVRAEQVDPKKKPVQRKPVVKQNFAPKQQHVVTKTPVRNVHTERKGPTVRDTARIHDNNAPKQHVNTLPAVQSNKSDKLHAVQTNKTNTLPAVQSNKVQSNQKIAKTFHPQHQNFHAQQKSTVASVQFNKNFHIHGANNWKGPHYQVFKSYHPQWHDQGWWHSHHNRIVLIGGGYYYWDGGYWYPAWGYDNSAAYYPYDGPIYSGPSATPLDQVIADVQSALQEQGYYKGEVDGLLGPMTQEALSSYQSAQGLEATAAIDEPTLAALGLAG